uniref:TNF superfamily member 9 n=1 Tax=Catagonus wagneri TaxID=51154 RepID=A0A8C3W9Z7_9CETA
MHSSSDNDQDPEAQRPPAPPGRACRPLPWALSVALLLFAAASAVCLVRSWTAPGAPAAPGPAPSPRLPEGPELTSDALAGFPDSPQGMFQQDVFAQLVVADGEKLTKGPLHWYSEPGMKGVTLTPGVRYDRDTHELVVAKAGVYYVFLHLALKRVVAVNSNSNSSSDSVSVALHLQPSHTEATALALTLDLPPPSSGNSAAGFRGGLLHLGAGQRLGVHLHPELRKPLTWQLSDTTALGLFRVATRAPAGLPSPQLS